MGKRHSERHSGKRGGWLRAAVLGANDGLVSTASLAALPFGGYKQLGWGREAPRDV